MQPKDKDKTEAPQKPIEKKVPIPAWPDGLVISRNEKISVSIADDFAIILTKEAFEQLFGWAYSTSREISCLGSVLRKGNRFIIERFYLLKQSGSLSSTELDQDSVAELLEQLISEGRKDEASRIKCWAHSHPNMGTFWSTTDDQTCKLLVTDYLISIVVSNNFTARCRIDISGPIPIVFDNIPILYQMPKEKIAMEKYADEVRNAVSEKAFVLTKEDALLLQQPNGEVLIPCDFCGGCHPAGECPIVGSEHWPLILDDEVPF